MREFVLLFRMDITTPLVQPSKAQMAAYMEQWMKWINGIQSQNRLADGGNHFSPQGVVLKSNKEVLETPYIADGISVAGYIIVLAENLGEATKIASECPILDGQNTSVEIRETATPGE